MQPKSDWEVNTREELVDTLFHENIERFTQGKQELPDNASDFGVSLEEGMWRIIEARVDSSTDALLQYAKDHTERVDAQMHIVVTTNLVDLLRNTQAAHIEELLPSVIEEVYHELLASSHYVIEEAYHELLASSY